MGYESAVRDSPRPASTSLSAVNTRYSTTVETTLYTAVNGQLKAGFTFRLEYIKHRVSLLQRARGRRRVNASEHVVLENWAKKGSYYAFDVTVYFY